MGHTFLGLYIQDSHLLAFFLALLFSTLTIPLVRRLCIKKGLYDIPNDRKIHAEPIPRLGGVSIWFSCIFTMLLLIAAFWRYPHGNALSGISAGGTIIFLTGLFDDIYNLSPKVKLFFQVVAACVAYIFGVQVLALQLPFVGDPVQLGILSLPITVFWIVAICNAINFIDGVDGLAGGVTALSALTLGVVAFYTNQPIAALVAASLVGSMLGFLVYNFHPAKIFMGDSGALFAGFVLASLSITGVLKTFTVTLLLPVLILSVPLLDITYAVCRRLMKGKSPFIADGEHIHHKLLKAGISQNRTIVIFYLVCIASGAIAASLVDATITYLLLLVLLVSIMFVIAKVAKNKNQKVCKLQ